MIEFHLLENLYTKYKAHPAVIMDEAVMARRQVLTRSNLLRHHSDGLDNCF